MHAANLFSSSAALSWLSGQDRIRTYKLPDTHHEKSFCATCGSALPGVQMDGALLVVPAGSLDSPVEVRPDAHICTGTRAEWDAQLDEIPEIEGLPG